MSARGEPTFHPIGMLPTIAFLLDEGLRDGREHYATLLEARSKPWVLDDATIARVKRVHTESLGYCDDVYEEQLRRWRTAHLTAAQRREVKRLEQTRLEWRLVLTQILELADELARGTIERQLAKSDLELGAEYLMGLHPPLR